MNVISPAARQDTGDGLPPPAPPLSSNLARTGVDDRIIDHFMGHQTEEVRRRYQHLFPEEKGKVLSRLKY